MATDNLSDEQLRQLRLMAADYIEPYWYANITIANEGDQQLDDIFVIENCDIEQAAARALELRAAALQAGLGGVSSQGITINADTMARGLLVEADRLRQSYRRA